MAFFEPYTEVSSLYYYYQTRIVHEGTLLAGKLLQTIKKYYDKYWITISYDLTLYNKDRRYSRYKIAFPAIISNPDGTYDLDLKNQDVVMNIRGSDLSYYMAYRKRTYPEYF